MHRVVLPPGKQAESQRYSVAYALKPPGNAWMERLRGGNVIPSVGGSEDGVGKCMYDDFHAKKSKGLREGKNLAGSRGEVNVGSKVVVA